MKKALSVLVVLALVLAVIPAAFAADADKVIKVGASAVRMQKSSSLKKLKKLWQRKALNSRLSFLTTMSFPTLLWKTGKSMPTISSIPRT